MRVVPLLVLFVCGLTISAAPDLSVANEPAAAVVASDADEADYQALQQQADPNSTYFKALNGNGETRPGISYTNIATKYDEVVTPYRQAFVTAGPGATVANITLQDICGNDYTDHLGIVYDSNVYQVILNALDPADQRPVACRTSLPVFGT